MMYITMLRRYLLWQKNKKEAGQDEDASVDFLYGLKKEDKITPVITIVVYFGQKPWDGPKCIHEMLTTKSLIIIGAEESNHACMNLLRGSDYISADSQVGSSGFQKGICPF